MDTYFIISKHEDGTYTLVYKTNGGETIAEYHVEKRDCYARVSIEMDKFMMEG